MSKLLVASYVFDWIIIIAAAAVGGLFAKISPNKRPFSLTNPEISFPHVVHEKVPLVALGFAALFGPAIIIFLICLFLVPGPTVSKSTPKSLIWKRKLWEWHTGWLGLALSLAATFVITNGMKNLFGKPRPDLLSRCVPDLANVASHSYSIFKSDTALSNFNVVSATVCTQADKSLLDDGFRSFPSGHASFSAAGLIYLSLFLASKLAITLPFLVSGANTSQLAAFPSRVQKRNMVERSSEGRAKSLSGDDLMEEPTAHDTAIVAARNQAAAPPVYLLVFATFPFFVSIYIASTRYSDFRHHGFDILFGYLIGTICAVFAFRFYHLPINTGGGWSWGPRSHDRSFWAGVGVGNYVGTKETDPTVATRRTATDLEAGRAMERSNGRNDVNDVGIIRDTSYDGAR